MPALTSYKSREEEEIIKEYREYFPFFFVKEKKGLDRLDNSLEIVDPMPEATN